MADKPGTLTFALVRGWVAWDSNPRMASVHRTHPSSTTDRNGSYQSEVDTSAMNPPPSTRLASGLNIGVIALPQLIVTTRAQCGGLFGA